MQTSKPRPAPATAQTPRATNHRWLGMSMALAGTVLLSASVLASDADCDCDEITPYPTAVIADYVLGCMSANGNTYEALHQCSCSIDYIMSRMDYESYEKVSTIMQVQLDRGQRGIFYRDSNWAKRQIEAMESIQAESTLRCF